MAGGISNAPPSPRQQLLEAEGWSHAPEPDEDGGTGYERDGVRLELTFLAPGDGGEVYIPLRAGRVLWSDENEPLSTDFGELSGVRARVLELAALKRGKARSRDDQVEAARIARIARSSRNWARSSRRR